jgi:hypothetical protein
MREQFRNVTVSSPSENMQKEEIVSYRNRIHTGPKTIGWFAAISHYPRDDAIKAFRPKSLSCRIRCKQFHMSSVSCQDLPECLPLPIVFSPLPEPRFECCAWSDLTQPTQCAGNTPRVRLVSISDDGQDGAATESPEKYAFPSFFLRLLARRNAPQPASGWLVVIFVRTGCCSMDAGAEGSC